MGIEAVDGGIDLHDGHNDNIRASHIVIWLDDIAVTVGVLICRNAGSEPVHKHDALHVNDAVINGKVALGWYVDVVGGKIHLGVILIINHIHHTVLRRSGERQFGHSNQDFRHVGVVAVQGEPVLAVSNPFNGQAVCRVGVRQRQEVAVVVEFLGCHKVALIMVKHEIHEVIVRAVLGRILGICPQVAGHEDGHHTHHLG